MKSVLFSIVPVAATRLAIREEVTPAIARNRDIAIAYRKATFKTKFPGLIKPSLI